MKEINKKIKSNNKLEKEAFPEHSFIASCLKVGLKIDDLKKLSYMDVLKILLNFIENANEKTTVRNATQADIDRMCM